MEYQKAYEILLYGITTALVQLDRIPDKNLQIMKARILLRSVQHQADAALTSAKKERCGVVKQKQRRHICGMQKTRVVNACTVL